MSIEKRLLDVAHNAFMEKSYAHEMTAAEERDAIAYTIEAYEAAKWRPIEEAPRNANELEWFEARTICCIVPMIIGWEGDYWQTPEGKRWTHRKLISREVIYRTIDPLPVHAGGRRPKPPQK